MPLVCIHSSATLVIFEYVHKIIPDTAPVISPPLCIVVNGVFKKSADNLTNDAMDEMRCDVSVVKDGCLHVPNIQFDIISAEKILQHLNYKELNMIRKPQEQYSISSVI